MPYTKAETDAYVKIRGRIVGARIVSAMLVGVILITLKSFGALDWSWWWVTSPLWGSVAYFIIALVGIAVFGAAQLIAGADHG